MREILWEVFLSSADGGQVSPEALSRLREDIRQRASEEGLAFNDAAGPICETDEDDFELASYLRAARRNALAASRQHPGSFDLIRHVGRLLTDLISSLDDALPLIGGFMAPRCHSVYRTSCGLALAGQLFEAHLCVRSCIETAAYAYYMATKPEHLETWVARARGEKERKKAKSVFQWGNVLGVLGSSGDHVLHRKVSEIYERSIDMGAHPNEEGFRTNLTVTDEGPHVLFLHHYLSAEREAREATMRLVTRAGLCAAGIFRLVFAERFAMGGLDARLYALWAQEWPNEAGASR